MINKTRIPLAVMLLLVLMALSAPLRAAAAEGSVSGNIAYPAQQQVACRTFPETSQIVGGRFLEYWRDHGGLAQQGYPISGEFQETSPANGQVYTVQYFERAVFEHHPENAAPNDVLLSLIGSFTYNQRYPDGAPGQEPNKSDGAVFFDQTGHWVGGGFLEYWQNHGGLAQQGYPISDEFNEVNQLDGQVYRVQYFERAVFEYHPQNDPGNRILLSQLGRFRLDGLYGGATPQNGQVFLNCQPDADADGVADAQDQCPDQAENFNGIFDTDGCPDTINDLVNLTAQDLNRYWGKIFKASEARYIPPVGIVPYTQPVRTACGRAALHNAFYCPGDHEIYFDSDFLVEQLNTDGDFAPVVIIAHEWGHLVQNLLGILDGSYPTIYVELQADCLAGSWVQDVSENPAGDALVRLDEGDIDEGAVALFRAGDDQDTAWFDPQAHGQPQQRVDSFELGLNGGVEACFSDSP